MGLRYEYLCESTDCERYFEVVKTVAEMPNPEVCPDCGSPAKKLFSVPMISPSASDWGKEEYNPGLGMVIKNARHRKEMAKRKGVEEIGNEKPETVHKHCAEIQADKRKKSWDSV